MERSWSTLLLQLSLWCLLMATQGNSAIEAPQIRIGPSASDISNFPSLADATIEVIQDALNTGLFTSVDLVKAYLARIDEVNPTLHAVTETNPDALSIAASIDAERANGKIRGPLHGIPILIKNNIATADKMNNTAGSLALLGAKVPRDSFMAKRLRDAGAIILGKANLSQWANFRSTNSSNGWSAHGGQVLGVYHEKQDPSGSSSGCGVATALGLAAACLGTETSGSILMPAIRSNIVGIKPSVGLTSRDLVIPISEHQDTVGPMARTVKEAAIVLQAIAGPDQRDNYTSAIPRNSIPLIPDYIKACDMNALQGARLGIPSNVVGNTRLLQGLEVTSFIEATEILINAGAEIVPNANFSRLDEFIDSGLARGVVLRADFVSNLATYLSQLTENPNSVHTLTDVRAFSQTDKREEYPDRNTVTWDMAVDPVTGFNNTDPRFWSHYQTNLELGGDGGLFGALDRNKLDAIILPASLSAGFAATVGAPVITVPLGFYPSETELVFDGRGDLVNIGPNVPYGFAFLGRKFDEARLIGLAYAFEQITNFRSQGKPVIMPRTEVRDVLTGGGSDERRRAKL